VRLPERATVVDMIDDRTIARESTEFDLELEENTAILLKLERTGSSGPGAGSGIGPH
jgi:hypothetical protein